MVSAVERLGHCWYEPPMILGSTFDVSDVNRPSSVVESSRHRDSVPGKLFESGPDRGTLEDILQIAIMVVVEPAAAALLPPSAAFAPCSASSFQR
jgi:hypothetical protein